AEGRRMAMQGMTLLEPPVVRRGAICTVAPSAPIDKVYTYIVPDALAERVVPGVRVRVPMGRGGRMAEAWCIERSEGDWDTTLREVVSVIDDAPLLPAALLELAAWMSRYYACPRGPALRAVAPAASRRDAGWRAVKYVGIKRKEPTTEETEGTEKSGQQPGNLSAKWRAALDVLEKSDEPVAVA